MDRFRKKPLTIEAIQYTPETRAEIISEFEGEITHRAINEEGEEYDLANLRINTLEGDMFAKFGDWVIRGIEGEVYPCADSVFQASYQQVHTVEGETPPDVDELLEVLAGVVDCAIWQSGAVAYPADSAWPQMREKLNRAIPYVEGIESEVTLAPPGTTA